MVSGLLFDGLRNAPLMHMGCRTNRFDCNTVYVLPQGRDYSTGSSLQHTSLMCFFRYFTKQRFRPLLRFYKQDTSDTFALLVLESIFIQHDTFMALCANWTHRPKVI